MLKWILAAALAATITAAMAVGARAEGEKPGEFDYYVMALSWNASWCAAEGDGRGADQCAARHDHGFTLHGLWPQGEYDWPSYCRTNARDPSRRQSGEMADIMGSGGLAWHQWKKHGRCSGLSATDYFRLSREAYRRIKRPEILRQLTRELSVAPEVVEAAFLEANPNLLKDGVTVTCRDGRLQEVRICLTRGLEPRACSGRVARDCAARSVDIPPMR